MSMSLEHDNHICLSVSKMEASDNKSKKGSALNLKATELRLGLPGSESPERDSGSGVEDITGFSFFLVKPSCVSGAKRVFSDAIDGASGKWVFSGSSGSEAELGKGGNLVSPRGGVNGGKGLVAGSDCVSQPISAMKDGVEQSPKPLHGKKPQVSAPAAKAQVVGWPPIRSFRKNSMASTPAKKEDNAEDKMGAGSDYIKVGMDGAPYLRKVDLKTYGSYVDLSLALEKMFSCFTIGQCGPHGVSSQDGLSESRLMDLLHGAEYVLTFEDKDGDWMLVGDVPWQMFIESCQRMRIMRSSEAIGLGHAEKKK